MLKEIPLGAIQDNPYNSRSRYLSLTVERLVRSFNTHGQLVPVKVRPSPKHNGEYELIYGHRRFLAAKRLMWGSIRAEVVEATDEQMAEQSLIENFEHEDLSDFEKALIFEKMNKEFNKTYEQIGNSLGISRQHVSNYIAMLRLFDTNILASNPELIDTLYSMTEHHARILSRLEDPATRIELAGTIIKEKLSVRELTNMVFHLRSWFPYGARKSNECLDSATEDSADKDSILRITEVLVNEFRLPHQGDFDAFEKMHLFGKGFSLYSAFPPFDRVEERRAFRKERQWFYDIMPSLSFRIKDLKVSLLGRVALSTLTVFYSGTYFGKPVKMKARGTVVLVFNKGSWRILHEHWSAMDTSDSDFSTKAKLARNHDSSSATKNNEIFPKLINLE